MYNVSFSGLVNRVFPPLYNDQARPDIVKIALRAAVIFAASAVCLSPVFSTIRYTLGAASAIYMSCFILDLYFNKNEDNEALYKFIQYGPYTLVSNATARHILSKPDLVKRLIELTRHNPRLLENQVKTSEMNKPMRSMTFMNFAASVATKEDYSDLLDAAHITENEFFTLINREDGTIGNKRFHLILEKIKASPDRFQHLINRSNYYFAWARAERLIPLKEAGFNVDGGANGVTSLMMLAQVSSFPEDFPDFSGHRDNYFRNRTRLLITLGANVNLINIERRTALDIAKEAQLNNGVYEVLKYEATPKKSERMM